MPTAKYKIGETFPAQFAWKLPDGDYLRAVFQADVIDLVAPADKYIVRLSHLEAGRQETKDGDLRPTEAYSQDYWELVGGIVGRKITLAYEADDGRAIHMRLATLTGEHNYFSRFADVKEMVEEKLLSSEDTSP